MSENCCATNGNVMILSCSGASNVGQLANQAAVELTQEGFGKMFCLAGVGGHLGGFIRSAKDIPEMVAIDGCDVGCARAILTHADVPMKDYLVLTDFGIEKSKDFNLKRADIDKAKEAVKKSCGGPLAAQPAQGNSAASCCCG
jgi:uncharacterized metal-binding protein